MSVRSRFAPSPTGYLHIGGVRTALYAYLYARKHQGQFILRIEDTDRERSTTESIQLIIDAMHWLGLDYDEGPILQTDRFDRYQACIEKLLAEGKAYRCYCSKERLDGLREAQMNNKEKPRYDGHCRDLDVYPDDKPYVIRFRNPLDGEVIFNDLVRGTVAIANQELDDLIIVRTDGTPTYNFSVVVDDLDMKVSHVIRGDDHINNTPRQIHLMHALGGSVPAFAHIPMILGPDGKRLSKRHGAASVMEYRDEGYLPQALLNYLVRLGWSHGDQELFSMDEMIELFDFPAVNSAPACINPEKLLWINQQYLKTLPIDEIAALLTEELVKSGINTEAGPAVLLVVDVLRERSKTLVEMAEKAACFYQDQVEFNQAMVAKHLTDAIAPALSVLLERLNDLDKWEKESIKHEFKHVVAQFEISFGKLAQPVRVAVTGNTVSPSIDVMLSLMGKERAISRLEHAISLCSDA